MAATAEKDTAIEAVMQPYDPSAPISEDGSTKEAMPKATFIVCHAPPSHCTCLNPGDPPHGK